jgi:hypothetical protein
MASAGAYGSRRLSVSEKVFDTSTPEVYHKHPPSHHYTSLPITRAFFLPLSPPSLPPAGSLIPMNDVLTRTCAGKGAGDGGGHHRCQLQ